MTTEAEHEAAVQRAVTEAVEGLDGPDRSRLARIERELLAGSGRQRNAPWWWALLGIGLAAGAGAAYIGYQAETAGEAVDAGAGSPEAVSEPRPESGAGEPGQDARDDDKAAAGDSAQSDDPVIYMGE